MMSHSLGGRGGGSDGIASPVAARGLVNGWTAEGGTGRSAKREGSGGAMSAAENITIEKPMSAAEYKEISKETRSCSVRCLPRR